VPAIKTIFWDVGGVLLTNAWDHRERQEAFARFDLDGTHFEARHDPLVADLESGRLSLDRYLEQTVFYRERPFTRDSFLEFMYACSKPKPEVLAIARDLAASRKYLMGTINNESRELNLFRIQRFGLRDTFRIFVSSCFVGLRKPDPKIYALALDLTQCSAQECCFIDDRPENLEPARSLGIHTVRMQSAQQLKDDFKKLGIEA
jgi:putative hydrolase of the HAD superfamily